jgi:hypothetical protein
MSKRELITLHHLTGIAQGNPYFERKVLTSTERESEAQSIREQRRLHIGPQGSV